MKIIYTLFIALFFNIAMFGTTYTSVADGNWSTFTTWSPAGVPQSGDQVIINTNVILDDQYTVQGYWSIDAGSLTINAGASLIAGTNVIGMAVQNGGTIVNNGTFSISRLGVYIGTVTNNSTCNFYSLIYSEDVIENYGTIQEVDSFYTSGTFTNYNNSTITSDSIYNQGIFVNDGSVTVNEMYNNNNFTNNGSFSFNRYYNNESFTNTGVINSTYDATNAGEWTNTSASSVIIAHSFLNADTLNTTPATLINDGNLNIGHDFSNQDTIKGSSSGYISVQDDSYNSGQMIGEFEFCDNTVIVTTEPYIDYNTGYIDPNIVYCQAEFVDNFSNNNELVLYPNPTTSTFNIFYNGNINNVKVINSVGAVLINENANSISVNGLSTGVYVVVIEAGNTLFKRKLIVE